MMGKKTKTIDESILIIQNLRKLENALKELSVTREEEKARKLVFLASLLIEKIIFYFQLGKGVEYIGTYRLTYNDNEEDVDAQDLYKYFKKLRLDEGLTISKLIKLRNLIANVYIKYVHRNRQRTG